MTSEIRAPEELLTIDWDGNGGGHSMDIGQNLLQEIAVFPHHAHFLSSE